MTAKRGTESFSGEASRRADDDASRIIASEVGKRRADFSVVPSLTYEYLLGRQPKVAYGARGNATKLAPRAGFIFYKDKLAAIPEIAVQANSQNAVERCYRWLAVALLPSVCIPLERLLFVFYGEAFEKDSMGRIHRQTGGVVEICLALGIPNLVNPTGEVLRASVGDMLDEIAGNPHRRGLSIRGA